MLIDLQLHSTYSDGYLTPTEVAKFAAKNGIKVAALTDHNTVSGLGEFRSACHRLNIKPIPGIELYCSYNRKKLNILWYNFDDRDPKLHDLLRESQVRRRGRMRTILKKLASLGFEIDHNRILDKYNHYVPLNKVIDDIISVPHNLQKIKKMLNQPQPREEDIISHFFKNKEMGMLKESNINIERVFKLKKKVGGQIILCHPAKSRYVKKDDWVKLKKMGLDGAELISPHHSIGAVMFIQHLSHELDFIETGGSDFHRFENGNNLVKYSWQYFKIESKLLKNIDKIID